MFSIPDFLLAKQSGKPIAMLTCYDAWTATALTDSAVDAVLVGDSAAMVVHGQANTLNADIPMIAAHTRAVRASAPGLCILADMPFLSTRRGLAAGVEAAGSLMQAGANGVKIEGLPGHQELIPHLIGSGIPVMGHLGLQPQSFNLSGGYKVQGRDDASAALLLEEALALQDLGCFAIVLECVPSDLAAQVSAALRIPTIGIGAGSGTDGQILVLQDMLGFGAKAKPRFVRQFLNGNKLFRESVNAFVATVKDRSFPQPAESYAGHEAAPQAAAQAIGSYANPETGPRLIRDPLEWKAYCRQLAKSGSIGFVPTMGALHQGHLNLARQAAADNDFALVSIFVNPAQFNDAKDLAAYPRTLEADCQLLAQAGVTAVFAPEAASMYPDGYHYKLSEDQLSQRWCGAFRPGHFDGVLSVVQKLLVLTGAQRAYFGEKDWQQLQLIRGMAEAFFLDTAILGCPTVREASGLAMSSRNARLSAKGREQAAAIYRILKSAPDAEAAKRELTAAGFEVEYVEDYPPGQRRLVACWLEGVRLIDNVPLPAAAAGVAA